MTTKVLIVNFGPATIDVCHRSPENMNATRIYSLDPQQSAHDYVHHEQEIVIKESNTTFGSAPMSKPKWVESSDREIDAEQRRIIETFLGHGDLPPKDPIGDAICALLAERDQLAAKWKSMTDITSQAQPLGRVLGERT